MRKLLGPLLFFSVLPLLSAGELTIIVENIKKDQGQILLAVYDSEENWTDEDKTYLGIKQKVDGGICTIRIPDLPDGTYAITLFHDKNSNDKLDKGLFGIPKEGYGFSNNALGKMGPPLFSEAAFEVKGQTSMRIKLKN